MFVGATSAVNDRMLQWTLQVQMFSMLQCTKMELTCKVESDDEQGQSLEYAREHTSMNRATCEQPGEQCLDEVSVSVAASVMEKGDISRY